MARCVLIQKSGVDVIGLDKEAEVIVLLRYGLWFPIIGANTYRFLDSIRMIQMERNLPTSVALLGPSGAIWHRYKSAITATITISDRAQENAASESTRFDFTWIDCRWTNRSGPDIRGAGPVKLSLTTIGILPNGFLMGYVCSSEQTCFSLFWVVILASSLICIESDQSRPASDKFVNGKWILRCLRLRVRLSEGIYGPLTV